MNKAEDYQVLITKDDCLSVVGCLKNIIKDIEIIMFGSNKNVDNLEIGVKDFKEENIILKIKPEVNNFKFNFSPVTIMGKSITYNIIGFMIGFIFDGKKYYARLADSWIANSDNRCFTIDSLAFEKFNFFDLFKLG